MGRAPSGWRQTRIRDLGEVLAGRQRSPNQSGALRPYLRVANVLDGTIDTSDVLEMPFTDRECERFRLLPGDVLVNEGQSRNLVGRSAVYRGDPPDCCIQNTIIRFRAGSDTDAEFAHQLFAWLRRAGRFSEIATQTTSIAHLGVSRFAQFVVQVPGIQEQHAIAVTLRAVDDAIAAGEAVVEQLRRLRKSLHVDLCAGRLAADRPRRNGPWGRQPVEWGSASLGEVVNPVRSPCAPKPGNRYVELGVRSHGKGVFLKDPVDGSTLGSKRVFFVEPGCLMLNIVFAWEGAVAVTGEEHRSTIASHRFPMFRCIEGAADPRFLRHLLLTQPGLRVLGVSSPGGAGRNRTLNQGMLLRTQIPCPPLHEQQTIADALDEFDRRISAEDSTLEGRRRVKVALADALLTGRARVRDAA